MIFPQNEGNNGKKEIGHTQNTFTFLSPINLGDRTFELIVNIIPLL